ncbi:MAG: aldehyde dehydrogenase [Chitinophagaceae bacterium]
MQSFNFKAMQVYFSEGNTLSYAFRKKQLQLLYEAIKIHETAILQALYEDLHKSNEEAFATEVGFVYSEIKHVLTHLENWMMPQKVSTPIILQPSTSWVQRDPLGVTCIIAPWNYPFQLVMAPLIGAIAGGNCAVIKPSEYTPNTASIIETIIRETFSPNYITTCLGDGTVIVSSLLEQNRFDHIFFTGSTTVGKIIAKLAAEKLTTTTLELGGKSPCIVDETAHIATAAKRIVFGKFTNAGQTCVAPDYLLVHVSVYEKLLEALIKSIELFYGKDASVANDYGRIVNTKRFEVLCSYLKQGSLLYGGKVDAHSRYISPTLMAIDKHQLDFSIMKEEIFGPILPIIVYEKEAEVLSIIQSNPNPLSLYLFSQNTKKQDFFAKNIAFGGGCINNTLVHLANPNLPFGGLGNSGVGQYHGKYTFETFTRPKGILKTATWVDLRIKYPPYKGMLPFLRWFMK